MEFIGNFFVVASQVVTLFLLMIVLYGGGVALTVWTFVTGKGTPLVILEPIAMHAVSIWLLARENDK